ncbi:YceK/YidQ family lipoprotein [Pseudomonas syringae]|uniref:YceK/YidQ family lipoprotein n=1 Tax=Pseudomonas syringae TaxID=317 RepID=UPI001F45F82F|nr:YceK/YidQ family lipoprotein [Pseudomonas syringae]MCF5701336.1 YceK/YidQ family lipoprotein [Pseudomonas syringae]
MRIQATILAALMLGGCGTVQTVVRNDQVAVDSLKKQKSYCGAVPRIYSGLAYDFCSLHAPLGEGVEADDYKNAAIPVVLIDAVISGALDTFLLPYTIYKQQVDGSIVIN